MPRDKKILYVLAALAPVGLIPLLLLNYRLCIPLSAAWLAALALAAHCLLRKRRAPSLHCRTILLITAVFALLYCTLFHLSGFYFGFLQSLTVLSASLLLRELLPITIMIIACELVRRILLSQEKRLPALSAFILGVLSELAITGGLQGLSGFNAMMDMIGLTLLPAVAAGALYQFLSAQHGALPAIAYRAILTLFPFFLPVTPDIPNALKAFLLLLTPVALLLFLRLLFEKRVKKATVSPRARHVSLLATLILLLLATGMILLISGQVRYTVLVIATGSMTGELNVGDVTVYERYEGQTVKTGDILVFHRDQSLIVHRVIEITHVNAQTRYYTKGDANESPDVGFITDADIEGIIDFKIPFIGYTSIWMRRMLEIGS